VTHPLSIRLEKALDTRLERLAKMTGRTKSFYVKQAIAEQLGDLEDAYLARKVAARVAAGKERLIGLAEVERELGLED
jgi:RHH-type transcriptional regulator, rel operon repressor / antitoxin RelB